MKPGNYKASMNRETMMCEIPTEIVYQGVNKFNMFGVEENNASFSMIDVNGINSLYQLNQSELIFVRDMLNNMIDDVSIGAE